MGGGGLRPPPPPKEMPEKPLDAFKAFCKENSGNGKGLGELAKMYQELSAEEKEEKKKEAEERQEKYNEDLAAFKNSPIGKRYEMMLKGFEKKKRIQTLKAIMQRKEPRKPPNAQQIFASEKRVELMKDNPDLKGPAVQQKIDEMWKD